MHSLDKDLQTTKTSITEFANLAKRVIEYLPNIISDKKIKGKYIIFSSDIAGTEKFVRPINTELILLDLNSFDSHCAKLIDVFKRIKSGEVSYTQNDYEIIDKTLYTIQQIIGAGLDLLVNPNSARKHAGNRFEELIKCVFDEIGVANNHLVLKIPYETDDGTKVYKCENDLILSPHSQVRSTSGTLDKNEVVVSVKTTSKDRMGKIFIDKILLQEFVKHDQKVIGIFLNDVQRKEKDNISHTLVSGLFMVYTKFLTNLDGIYYLDPPPTSLKPPYNKYMHKFSKLLIEDLQDLLTA